MDKLIRARAGKGPQPIGSSRNGIPLTVEQRGTQPALLRLFVVELQEVEELTDLMVDAGTDAAFARFGLGNSDFVDPRAPS